MHVISKFKSFFIAGLLLSTVACHPDSSKKKETTNDKTATDTSIASLQPPGNPPPSVEMIPTSFTQKCFENKGSEYDTKVNIIYLSDTTVAGQVTSYNLANYKEETTGFEGIVTSDKLTIKFTTPVIGAASEWTNKPWVIKKAGDKESLIIVFNAKNDDANNQGKTTYERINCQ